MLGTTGIVLESMLRPGLAVDIVSAGDLAPYQHGFRIGHSTIDTIEKVVEAVRKTESQPHLISLCYSSHS